ncbi:MAG: flagellar biosynthesis protein FlhB [Candidatus Eisenbacteria sp.]|nr:flagellar biosynthesis protein FlhB [Candidatus Eisenbacteria bacterium]
MPEAAFHERTEPATPRRRRQAREEGKVARSQEVNSAFILLASLGVLALAGPFMLRRMMGLTRAILGATGQVDLRADLLMGYFSQGLPEVLLTLVPLAGTVLAVGLLVNFAQVGLVFSWKPLAPRLDALSPTRGVGRIFSKRGAVELLKSLIKIALIGGIAYVTLREEIPRINALLGADPLPLYGYAATVVLKLGLRVALVMIGLAIADYAFQRWDFERSIMMSHREVEEELRHTEGDPRVRARVRAVQREISRRRMMENVKTADIVVTNPTRVAVALRYERQSMDAPKVVAKGERLLAQRIKDLARKHGVPVVEDRPLARMLLRVEIDAEIPVTLYRAVAELLAYVFRLRQQRYSVAHPA